MTKGVFIVFSNLFKARTCICCSRWLHVIVAY